ncbi:MAG: hypothetical protein QM775_09060 [Pirellulales bacterium]
MEKARKLLVEVFEGYKKTEKLWKTGPTKFPPESKEVGTKINDLVTKAGLLVLNMKEFFEKAQNGLDDVKKIAEGQFSELQLICSSIDDCSDRWVEVYRSIEGSFASNGTLLDNITNERERALDEEVIRKLLISGGFKLKSVGEGISRQSEVLKKAVESFRSEAKQILSDSQNLEVPKESLQKLQLVLSGIEKLEQLAEKVRNDLKEHLKKYKLANSKFAMN